MKKWIILIIVVLILGAATVYRIHILATTEPAESLDKIQQRDGIPVRVFTVRRENLKETVAVSGAIQPFRQIKIATTLVANERIDIIHTNTAEKVEKGQILVTLDDRESKMNVQHARAVLAEANETLARLRSGSRPEEIETAKAKMEQAQAGFDLLKIELERQQKLYKEEATTLQRLQDTESRHNNTKAALTAAKAQYELTVKGPRKEDIAVAEARQKSAEVVLSKAKKNLDDHYLKAPFAGVVSRKILEAGDVAESNVPIFHLVDIGKVYLDLNISELHIPKISVQMQVRITVDALPEKDFTGTIAEINPIANTTDRSYVTRILIENKEGLLRPGMFARGHIVIKDIKQAIVIPSDALHNIDGKNSVLIVDETLTARRREIAVDGLFDGMVVVIDGLSEGEKVITLSRDVQPGNKVCP